MVDCMPGISKEVGLRALSKHRAFRSLGLSQSQIVMRTRVQRLSPDINGNVYVFQYRR